MRVDNLTEIGSLELKEPYSWQISGRAGYSLFDSTTLITPLRFKDESGTYAVELRRELPSSSYSNKAHIDWLKAQDWAIAGKQEDF
jgi:hypothetical protein